MRMHYELLPCEKLHYKAHLGSVELSAPTLGRRGECSEMSHFLPEASLKQGEDSNVSVDGLRSVRFKTVHHSKLCDKSVELSVDFQ